MPGIEHRQHEGLNSRAENSHENRGARTRTFRVWAEISSTAATM
jgi:transposase-like protein